MSAATRIIAVRHGETDWNVDTRIQGHTDIDLNDTGRMQAERLGRALASSAVAAIYSSDLRRAVNTAGQISRFTPLPEARQVHRHAGLRERSFGIFEGHTYAAIEAQWPEESRRWKIRDPHFAPHGGESPTQMMERVKNTVNELAARHTDQEIVLVAHGGVLDMLYRLATGQGVNTSRTWELANASINRLLWTPDTLTLVGWADVHHLSENARDETST